MIPLPILSAFLVGFAAASVWRHEAAYKQGWADAMKRIERWQRSRR